ncbi:MAG: hypothetical protein QM652_10470 [Legionella sp.]|uniref:hypothetical protein n=1 Tax=Legionella sp. TaxID=459 RepID=UPI0039E6F752
MAKTDHTNELTKFYGRFFWGCGKVAIAPYKTVLTGGRDFKNCTAEDLFAGAVACVVLSTVVPILPALTSITWAVAFVAASLALASMFITYPTAILLDAFEPRFNYA